MTMSGNSDTELINQLQQEWRGSVMSKLERLNVKAEDSVSIKDYETLASRVSVLEESRAKFMGIILGVNAIVLIIAWLIERGLIKGG